MQKLTRIGSLRALTQHLLIKFRKETQKNKTKYVSTRCLLLFRTEVTISLEIMQNMTNATATIKHFSVASRRADKLSAAPHTKSRRRRRGAMLWSNVCKSLCVSLSIAIFVRLCISVYVSIWSVSLCSSARYITLALLIRGCLSLRLSALITYLTSYF